MPFCTNCGKQFPDDTKFCPECGTPVVGTQSQDQGQRKQEYAGEIRKCPNCGEPLSAFEVKCHACGFELRNVKNSTAVQEFYQKIEEIEAKRNEHKPGETERSIANVIRNYPIPNTKEDVLEFMMLAASNIDTSVYSVSGSRKNSEEYQAQKLVSDAWYATAEQVYHKAEVSFGEDPAFSKIQEIYTKKIKNVTSAKRKGKINNVLNGISSPIRGIGALCKRNESISDLLVMTVVLMVIAIVVPLFMMNREERKLSIKEEQLETIVVEVQECIENKDYDTAFIKASTLYMNEGSNSDREKWDKIRKDLIAMIETKSGVSYTSGTSSKDTSTSDSLKEAFDGAKEVIGEGVDTVKGTIQEAFSDLFG